jgi:hypothetical protein
MKAFSPLGSDRSPAGLFRQGFSLRHDLASVHNTRDFFRERGILVHEKEELTYTDSGEPCSIGHMKKQGDNDSE